MNDHTKHLTRRSVKAGTWLVGYRFFARFINLLKTPIIARILKPEQFGVFGVVSITLNLFETFTETGLEQALIHQKKITNQEINTAWIITLVRSLLISFGIYLTAPLVANFFDLPQTIPMIQLIAFTPIMRALRNPTMVILKRNLNFKPETIMLGLGSLAEVIVAIALTLHWQTEWALIWSIAAGATTELIVSYLIFPKPTLASFNPHVAIRLIHFGKWLWSSSVLSYLANQGDDIIVGRLLGPASLGLYQNAYKIASLPATQISGTITQVTFPAFASIQEDPHRLMRAFKKSLIFTCITTIPISLFILVFAQPLTLLIFGENWLGLVPSLRILSIYGIIRSISGVLGPLAVSKGRPELIAYTGVIRTLVLFSIIYPLTRNHGIEGASWATVIGMTFANIALYFKLKDIIRPKQNQPASIK